MTITQILLVILVGGIAGLLADALVKGKKFGLLGAIIVGILGGFIGAWVFAELNISINPAIVGQLAASFVGAVLLLLILRFFSRR